MNGRPDAEGDDGHGRSYRREHDHLIEPFFGGLHPGEGSPGADGEEHGSAAEPAAATDPAAAAPGRLRIVRTWFRAVIVRVRRP